MTPVPGAGAGRARELILHRMSYAQLSRRKNFRTGLAQARRGLGDAVFDTERDAHERSLRRGKVGSIDYWPWRADPGSSIGQRYRALRQARRGIHASPGYHFQLVALMAQRAKLLSLQTCAFEQAVEEQWEIKGVGVTSRQRQFDTVFFDASQG